MNLEVDILRASVRIENSVVTGRGPSEIKLGGTVNAISDRSQYSHPDTKPLYVNPVLEYTRTGMPGPRTYCEGG